MCSHSTPRFYIYTLGCKLNFAESSALVNDFIKRGWLQVRLVNDADWIIIHSCAVTAVAEKKTRQTISKLKRINAHAGFILTGCMADVNAPSLEKVLADRNCKIIGNSRKMTIPALLSGESSSPEKPFSFSEAFSLEQRTRSFLKIQDGCDYFCTYCTVPFARGRSTSNTIAGVLNSIEDIASKGFREIILTGVNIATFGLRHNESFFQLLEAINNRFDDIRIRMGSTEPELMSPEIIRLVASSRVIMPHFHLPLQSGCDNTLKRMHRHYDTALFRDRVETIKQHIPHACIAVDVITGFPGETAGDAEQTLQYIQELPVSYLHVFPYSDRPLASASRFPDHVREHEIRQRVNSLLDLGNQKQKAFFELNINTIRTLLTEGTCKSGLRFGFTDNYIRCAVPQSEAGENDLIAVQLDTIEPEGGFMLASCTK